MREQKSKKQSYEIANSARKKQIKDNAARLLQLATELKAEVASQDFASGNAEIRSLAAA